MALGSGPDFMQNRSTRIALNALVSVITAYYAAQAVGSLIRPSDQYALLIEQIGMGGYYALTGAQLVVCVWVSFVFARMTVKQLREKDDKK